MAETTGKGSAPPKDSNLAMGTLFVEAGAVTAIQLERASRIAEKLKKDKPVGELLVELGQLSRADHDRIVLEHRSEITLAEILLEDEALIEGGFEAYQRARTGNKDVSERQLLVENRLCSEDAYLKALATKYGIPVVQPEVALVDRELLGKASVPYLIRQHSLPFRVIDDVLHVIMADPLDRASVASLEQIYRRPLKLCSAPAAKIDEALELLESWRKSSDGEQDLGLQYREIQNTAVDDEPGEEVVRLVDHLLLRAIKQGASDLHIEPLPAKVRVRARVDGVIRTLTSLPPDFSARLASRFKVLAGCDIAERRLHQDGRIVVRVGGQEVDIRVSTYVSVFGESLVLRILDRGKGIVGLEALGLETQVLKSLREIALRESSGLTLVTGPTGSGKTTTLYSLVDHLLDDTTKVITCEDPVEYVLEGVTQCSVNQKTGPTFADSLKAILRQDPDVIVVGEIRDRVTTGLAVEAALTGHKVLSTFHTEDAVGSVVRLLEMGVEPFLASSTINCIIAQRLIRRLCVHCRKPGEPNLTALRFLGVTKKDLEGVPVFTAVGCDACAGTGFKGRLGVHEVLMPDDHFRDAILTRASSNELRALARKLPVYLSLQEDGLIKAVHGDTTFEALADSVPRDERARPIGLLRQMAARRRVQ